MGRATAAAAVAGASTRIGSHGWRWAEVRGDTGDVPGGDSFSQYCSHTTTMTGGNASEWNALMSFTCQCVPSCQSILSCFYAKEQHVWHGHPPHMPHRNVMHCGRPQMRHIVSTRQHTITCSIQSAANHPAPTHVATCARPHAGSSSCLMKVCSRSRLVTHSSTTPRSWSTKQCSRDN